MKKNYHAPQIRAFALQGGSPMLAASMPVSTEEKNKTSGDAGGWSKEFWGVVDDDEEDNAGIIWE